MAVFTSWIQRKLLKSFSCCFNYRSCAKIYPAGTRKREPILDSLIWQPRLFLIVSRFSCPDNVRPNFRTRRLVVVFPTKANLLVLTLTIFKQRLPISVQFYYSTVSGLFTARECETDPQANDQLELDQRKSWSQDEHLTYCPPNECVDTCARM